MVYGECLVHTWHIIGVQQIFCLVLTRQKHNFEPWYSFPLISKYHLNLTQMAGAYVVNFLLGDILKNVSSTRELLASNVIGGNCANTHDTIPILLITEHLCSKVTLILV